MSYWIICVICIWDAIVAHQICFRKQGPCRRSIRSADLKTIDFENSTDCMNFLFTELWQLPSISYSVHNDFLISIPKRRKIFAWERKKKRKRFCQQFYKSILNLRISLCASISLSFCHDCSDEVFIIKHLFEVEMLKRESLWIFANKKFRR